MNGIPDPGRASRAIEIAADVSPFDAGRTPCAQGGEDRWSARWLMEQLGYPTWQHFEPVIERAKTTAHNEGFNVRTLFTVNRENSGGRPRTDYLVTRYAAYLIAMNGDTRKPAVSAAQHYFATRTREAEVASTAAVLDLTDPDVALDKIIELATFAKAERTARLQAEARAQELAPPAAAWNQLADAVGDYAVTDAAKVLSRDPKIQTGERRLFDYMAEQNWIFRSVTGRWRIYQTQIENGRLAEKVGKPYWHEGRGEYVTGDPIVRVTPKGLAELHKRLGGTGQIELLAAV